MVRLFPGDLVSGGWFIMENHVGQRLIPKFLEDYLLLQHVENSRAEINRVLLEGVLVLCESGAVFPS